MSTQPSNLGRAGDAAYASLEKINPELFTMTYGALVIQLLRDFQDITIVNSELFKMGYNMGIRMIDEFLAHNDTYKCSTFAQTCTTVAKVALKMFLGIDATCISGNTSSEHLIRFSYNPLYEYVELPPGCAQLIYANVICGAVAGALRSLNLVVECNYVQDMLRGAPADEIHLKLVEVLQDQYQEEEE